MNILGWYRTFRNPLANGAAQVNAVATTEPTEVQHREPMLMHHAADMAPLLMPWQVLTQLTAIHLHHASGLALGGHEADALRGAVGAGLDPIHFLGGLGSAQHLNTIHPQLGSAKSPQGLIAM